MSLTDWDTLRYVSTAIACATFIIMLVQLMLRWRNIYTWKMRIIWGTVFFSSAVLGSTPIREISLHAPGNYVDVLRIIALILLFMTAIAPIDDGEPKRFPNLKE